MEGRCDGGQAVPPYPRTPVGPDGQKERGACPSCGCWGLPINGDGRVRAHQDQREIVNRQILAAQRKRRVRSGP